MSRLKNDLNLYDTVLNYLFFFYLSFFETIEEKSLEVICSRCYVVIVK